MYITIFSREAGEIVSVTAKDGELKWVEIEHPNFRLNIYVKTSEQVHKLAEAFEELRKK